MEKEFATYEQASALKELGFDESCFATYDEDKEFEIQDFEQTYDTFPSHIIAAPLYQQAFRWFREKHGLCGVINPFSYEILEKNHEHCEWGCIEEVLCETYEELACLRKLIEIVKQKQQ